VYILTSVGSVLFIRARDSVTAAEKGAREIWPRFLANSIPDIRPARDLFAASYADDARLARLLALCTLVAMLIAACGAYVLAADAVRRRRREIALRKLFGARHRHIGGVVARELGTLLLLAAAIGLPLGGLGIARHLAPFVERTPWSYAGLAIALVAAGVVVAAAAAHETRHAMRARPAHALRGD
jgi:predicted lysophospholipase L1 biosynthesis ABC-type transport system permease subunit